jgi:TolB-like protein
MLERPTFGDQSLPDPPNQLRDALAGRYRLERELGQGGMATVYLAQDLRHDRPVALKVLHPQLATTLGPERFLREIATTAKLRHPHIVPLYDSGDAAGSLFYVMPVVEGESLRDRLRRERQLPLEEALRIAAEVADALAYAHDRGVIHRDIKPENVLLEGGHAMVADFGIASAADGPGWERLTETGMSLGTPLYMSPEQATGERTLDERSDVYSLAAMVYEMLTGEPPFSGPTPQAVMAKLAAQPPVPLHVLRPTVPATVERAVLKGLAKAPADRFATARQFSDALLQIPPRSRRIRRLGVVAIAVLAIGLTAAAVWRWWPARADGAGQYGGTASLAPQRVAVLYLEPHGGDPDLAAMADGLTEGLIDSLRLVTPLSVISSAGVSQFRGAHVSVEQVARELKVESVITGSVSRTGDRFEIAIQLRDGRTGAASEPRTFEATLSDILPIQGAMARAAVSLIVARPREHGRAAAWVVVQRARQARRQGEESGERGDQAGLMRAFGEADTLAERAAGLDESWPEPLVLRGQLAYRRAYLLGREDPQLGAPWIDSGMAQIGRAFALSLDDPDALEVRGNLEYWRWLLGLEPDSTKAKKLLLDAQADLEKATAINPAQVGAWASLSHLYSNIRTKGEVDAYMAARSAYEADPYISNADKVLRRLFWASYDLGHFQDAGHWCDEGTRRFPTNPQIVKCRLELLATTAERPDVTLAWRLADSLNAMGPAPNRTWDSLYNLNLVAGVIGRAGLSDSAHHVAARAKGDAIVDPQADLAEVGAFAYVLMGDKKEAVQRLKAYFAASPARVDAFRGYSGGWWFRDIREDPGYKQLIGSRK